MGEWRYSSTILDLGTRWRWVVSFTDRPLHPRYPLDMRLSGPQSQSGRCGEDKILPLPGIEPWPSSSSLYWQLSRLLFLILLPSFFALLFLLVPVYMFCFIVVSFLQCLPEIGYLWTKLSMRRAFTSYFSTRSSETSANFYRTTRRDMTN
jgi:hypothetical protein